MKKLLKTGLFIIAAVFLVFGCTVDPGGGEVSETAFVSTWDTSNTSTGSSAANQVSLPLEASGTYDFTVNWGDGNTESITAWDAAVHTYSVEGIYEISIEGIIRGFSFADSGDKEKLTEISQFGTLQVGDSNGYFYGCSYLTVSAYDLPDLSLTTTMMRAFQGCAALTSIPNISNWDVSTVTNMQAMFAGATNFNSDLTNWNVENVLNMSSMFYLASGFNGDVVLWNVSGVSNMYQMFRSASAFNQAIGGWTTTSLTNVIGMFQDATGFQQSIGGWDISGISNLTDMATMFAGVTLPTAVYSDILVDWAAKSDTLQSGITFNAGSSQFNASAVAARVILTNFGGLNWQILDSGQE